VKDARNDQELLGQVHRICGCRIESGGRHVSEYLDPNPFNEKVGVLQYENEYLITLEFNSVIEYRK
jgi:hypothetical protein